MGVHRTKTKKPDTRHCQRHIQTHLLSRRILMIVEIRHGSDQRRVGTRVGASMTRSRCLGHTFLIWSWSCSLTFYLVIMRHMPLDFNFLA